VSKFKSLAAELEGHYGKPEHHLPDDLRARVRRAFAAFYPWDVLSSDRQRDWASRWWRGRAAFQEDAQRDPVLDEQDFQSGWDSIAKPEALERQILEWEATSTPTATDLEKKELRLAELRRELASLIPGRPTSTADEPQEQSVAPAKDDAPADAELADVNARPEPSAEALPPELYDAKTRGAPLQFLMWAVKEKAAHGVVLQMRAVDAMKELQPKPGRDTVIGWVRKLPESWRAKPGTSEAVMSRKLINPPVRK